MTDQEKHEAGMRAARARAQYELGDPDWAGIIVGAYLNPEEDEYALKLEMES